MRVLILADEFFASRERGLLTRLEVGLADDGVRVIHAVPRTARALPPGGVYSKVVTYSGRTLALTRGLVVRRLARALDDIDEAEGGADIDLIHVFGGSAWGLGVALAAELEAGLILEVWRSGLVPRARELGAGPAAALLLAPDPAIERALGADTGERRIRLAAWGVHTPPALRPVLTGARAVTAMIVGSGRDTRAFAAALTGLAAVARSRPDLHIFCDAMAARRAALWPLARKLNILPQLSLIEELEGRRDLLVQGDLLIQPDAHGESRSILLEAMAEGMIVVAAADPRISTLRDAQTARLVPAGDPAAWERVLTDILTHPDTARVLAASAYDYTRTQRRASDHVRAVLAAYESLRGTTSIPFPAPPP